LDDARIISNMNFLLPMLALFFGEALAIYGELLAAKGRPFAGLLIGLPGWPLLIWGYWAGCRAGGVWRVTAASIGSILIAEPLLVVLMFREAPERNALIGCLLGAAGIVVASMK